MRLHLILTDHGCVESDLSKFYGKHLFNWGIGSEKVEDPPLEEWP